MSRQLIKHVCKHVFVIVAAYMETRPYCNNGLSGMHPRNRNDSDFSDHIAKIVLQICTPPVVTAL